MTTYLIAWNPKRWQWDDLPELSNDVKEGKIVSIRWSCGKSRRLQIGDRVFIIRLGVEPKGIFASGTIIEGSYENIHWEDEKAALGEKALFIQIRLDVLLDPESDPILPREALSFPPFSDMHWDTQMSGVRIPDEIAEELDKAWNSFKIVKNYFLPEEIPESDVLFEGAKHQITVNAYERNSEARRKCIAFYGTSCSICGFNFLEFYGEEGRDLIHVHHLRQLAEVGEEYQVDPINDLRPICPNCHALIHRRTPSYSFDEMKAFLNRKNF